VGEEPLVDWLRQCWSGFKEKHQDFVGDALGIEEISAITG